MVMRQRPFAPKQRGWRFPKHTGQNAVASGTWGMLAAVPMLAGESMDVQDFEFNTILQTTTAVQAEQFYLYGCFMPWMFAGPAQMSDALIVNELAGSLHDPGVPIGGDPGTATGDRTDWIGEHEINGIEVFYENLMMTRTLGYGYDGLDDVVVRGARASGKLTKNLYTSTDGLLIWAVLYADSTPENGQLGVSELDDSALPESIQTALGGSGDIDVTDASIAAALRELFYGGDAYVGGSGWSEATLTCQFILSTRIKTPYPMIGNEWT